MTTSPPDKRRARGEERRRALVDAAMTVLGRDGRAGLTHRAVAEEAGVPLATVSYHFTGIEDLARIAMERATEDLKAVLEARTGERDVAGLARLLADEVNEHRVLWLAEYEVCLHSARTEGLGVAAYEWLDVLTDAFAPELDTPEKRALQATIDGVCLHAVLTGERVDAAAIERTLRLAWPGGAPPR